MSVMGALVLLLNLLWLLLVQAGTSDNIPAIISFGDSLLDVGNNNYLITAGPLSKCNQPPYGRKFDTRTPTGRFSDGELVSDIIAKSLNLPFPPAYLDPNANGRNLIHGVNFASGGAGILKSTSLLQGAATIDLQILWFREYRSKLRAAVGLNAAAGIIQDALYFVSVGGNDYGYKPVNPAEVLTDPVTFKQRLITRFTQFIEEIYSIGARKFVIYSIPPVGCTPGLITAYLQVVPARRCADFLNNFASDFNLDFTNKLQVLKSKLPLAKIVYLDVYNITLDLVKNPGRHGFTATTKGCCGTGVFEVGLTCNQASIGTCPDASTYVFWDAAHFSFATNRVFAAQLMPQLKLLK